MTADARRVAVLVSGRGSNLEALIDHASGYEIALVASNKPQAPALDVARWRGRIVNIHPSLLPKYRGLDTHQRALAAGDKMTGCTVHIVTEDLDSGEILAQTTVAINAGDDVAALSKKVLMAEHALYPATLSAFVRR